MFFGLYFEIEWNIEETQVHWLPTTRRLVAAASRVDKWDDCHGCTSIRQIAAACTTVIPQTNSQEVIHFDETWAGCRLDTLDHESVLGGYLFNLTLLLFSFGTVVSYFAQVDFDLSNETTIICFGSLLSLTTKHVGHGVAMVFSLQSDALFNLESDFVARKTTLAIIDIYESFSLLLGRVDIFFKMAPH